MLLYVRLSKSSSSSAVTTSMFSSLEFWLQIYWWNIEFKSGGSRSTDWIILVEILLSFGYYQLSFRKLSVIQLSISAVNGLYIY